MSRLRLTGSKERQTNDLTWITAQQREIPTYVTKHQAGSVWRDGSEQNGRKGCREERMKSSLCDVLRCLMTQSALNAEWKLRDMLGFLSSLNLSGGQKLICGLFGAPWDKPCNQNSVLRQRRANAVSRMPPLFTAPYDLPVITPHRD